MGDVAQGLEARGGHYTARLVGPHGVLSVTTILAQGPIDAVHLALEWACSEMVRKRCGSMAGYQYHVDVSDAAGGQFECIPVE